MTDQQPMSPQAQMNTQPQSVPAYQPIPEPSKSNGCMKVLVWLFTAVFFAALGFAASWYMFSENAGTTPTPTPTPEPTVEPTLQATAMEYAYVTAVDTESETPSVTLSLVNFLTAEDENYTDFCNEITECPNDYYIDAATPETLILSITETSEINVLTAEDEEGLCILTEDPVTPGEFVATTITAAELATSPCLYINADDATGRLFSVEYEGTNLVELSEVYLP